MVGILGMAQTFAHVVLLLEEVFLNLSWEGMKWDNYVSGVSNLLQFDVGNFLVVDVGWVMSWDEPWELWYVGLVGGFHF